MTDFTQEDRQLLADGVQGTLAKVGASGASVGGYPEQNGQVWADLAELGVMALPFAEEFGGLGLGGPETGTVMRCLGRFAAVEPYLSTVVLAGGVISRSDDSALKAALLPTIATGSIRLALAFSEPDSRYEPAAVATTAAASGAGFALSGHKAVVLGAPQAERFIVTARTDADATTGEVSFFLVERGAAGLAVNDYFTIDGRPAAEVLLDQAPAERISLPGSGRAVLEQVLDEAALAACWESVGAMERLNELTLAHCKDRVAFGQPLSKLQVIQHRLVDMHVAIEHAAAITVTATEAATLPATERAAQVSAAKVTVAKEGLFIGESAVQLHGAAGTTEDLDVGRYFKRILVNNMLFGNKDHHLQRYLELRLGAREARP
jgi:alkylation response protein AidB-like acyl-CoA dehydrogenase